MNFHGLAVFEFGIDDQELLPFGQPILGHNKRSTKAGFPSEITTRLSPSDIRLVSNDPNSPTRKCIACSLLRLHTLQYNVILNFAGERHRDRSAHDGGERDLNPVTSQSQEGLWTQ